jgi:hypothetical protein
VGDDAMIPEENLFLATPIQKKLINAKDGDKITIEGTVCPVHNATCVWCLYVNVTAYYMDNCKENDKRIKKEVWICPWGCDIENCKLNK